MLRDPGALNPGLAGVEGESRSAWCLQRPLPSMQLALALFLILHGIAHLVGVRAAFWPSITQLTRSSYLGRKLGGVVWLLLALGFLASAALLLAARESWTMVLLGSAAGSLAMCLLAWPEAKIGLVIDVVLVILLLLLSPSRASSYLTGAFQREVHAASLRLGAASPQLIDESAIAGLPEPVRRYLRFMGVVGRERDWSLRATFNARFRRDEGKWLECEALQYDRREPVARVFLMQLSLGGVLPVTVRDTYLGGRGSMLARAFDHFEVAEGHGYELDLGELVTYLNDAILLAPSLVLGPETTWKGLDEHSFEVTLRDGSLSVSARVWLDERGAPADFSTTDRYFDTPAGKRVRTEWRTPISGWQEVGGRKLPTRARAIWQLPTGPFPYADFGVDPARIAFNVPPA